MIDFATTGYDQILNTRKREKDNFYKLSILREFVYQISCEIDNSDISYAEPTGGVGLSAAEVIQYFKQFGKQPKLVGLSDINESCVNILLKKFEGCCSLIFQSPLGDVQYNQPVDLAYISLNSFTLSRHHKDELKQIQSFVNQNYIRNLLLEDTSPYYFLMKEKLNVITGESVSQGQYYQLYNKILGPYQIHPDGCKLYRNHKSSIIWLKR